MKFDESLVSKVKVGDLVCFADTLQELREIIESCEECSVYPFNEIEKIPEDPEYFNEYMIYDFKENKHYFAAFAYPITEIVNEPKLHTFLRIINRSQEVYCYREAVIEKFFELKRRGLLHGPSSREEEFAIDWSYDLQDPDYCEKLKEEIEDLSIEKIRYLFSKIDMNARFVFHDENMVLMEIKDSKEVFNAIRDMMLKFYNSLA